MKRIFLISTFILLSVFSFGTHYAITGTTWGAGGTTWAATSGGSATLGDPTAFDAVVFDGNSPNVTVSSFSAVGLTLTTTGYTGTISGGSGGITISGNVTFSATTTITVALITVNASSTITANGASIQTSVTLNSAGGTFNLGSDITLSVAGSDFNIPAGTLNTNNYNITAYRFLVTGAGTRVINLGSSSISVYFAGNAVNFSGSNITLNAGTSLFKYTSTSNTAATFTGNGFTFYDVWFSRGASTGSITITGTNTFHDLKDDGTAAHSIVFPNVTTTVTTFSISGTSGNLITLARTGASGTFTLSQASGAVCRDYLSISNSTVTGGATWNAGANSTDGGGNTGWTFAACGSSNTTNFFFKP